MTRTAVAALALAGCLSDVGPEVGPPLRPTCSDIASDPSITLSFANDVFAPILVHRGHCTKCHSPGGATPFGYADSGLDLSSYQTLLAGGTRSGADIVIAGKPCESILVQKLGVSPPYGGRMPLDGPPFLAPSDLQTIDDWIAEGAADN
jgi:hypothetical protein